MIKYNEHDKLTIFCSVKIHNYSYSPRTSNMHSFRAIQAITKENNPWTRRETVTNHSISNRQLLDFFFLEQAASRFVKEWMIEYANNRGKTEE